MSDLSLIPPSDKELEQSFLAAILMQPQLIDSALSANISPLSLYTNSHNVIFSAMMEINAMGENVDFSSVSQLVKKKGGQMLKIQDIELGLASKAKFETYCRRIKRLHNGRRMINAFRDSMTRLYSQSDHEAEMSTIEMVFASIQAEHTSLKMRSIHEVKEDFLKGLEARFEAASRNQIIGIPFNVPSVDRFINGWQAPRLYVGAARPAMGKTEFGVKAANEASKAGFPSAIITMEETDTGIFGRMVCQQSGTLKDDIERGTANAKNNFDKIKSFADEIADSGVCIDESIPKNCNDLISRCAQLIRKGIKFIVIDYLGLVPIEGKDDNKGLGEITRKLKIKICKELNTPVFLLHQLSRAVESRPNKRPILSDLRGSGHIEQDADVVMFFYRDEYYGIDVDENGNSTAGKMELIIAKQRGGATGIVNLKYIPSIGTIGEYFASDAPVGMLPVSSIDGWGKGDAW